MHRFRNMSAALSKKTPKNKKKLKRQSFTLPNCQLTPQSLSNSFSAKVYSTVRLSQRRLFIPWLCFFSSCAAPKPDNINAVCSPCNAVKCDQFVKCSFGFMYSIVCDWFLKGTRGGVSTFLRTQGCTVNENVIVIARSCCCDQLLVKLQFFLRKLKKKKRDKTAL